MHSSPKGYKNMCIFNKLQAADLFLALDVTSTGIDPSTSGRKYCKLVNNAVFIHNESLFVVSAATSAFQLSTCHGCSPAGYQIWENFSHVALWEILVARILGVYI